MVAGGDYHEPWTLRCPNPSAWTAYLDSGNHGNLLHRDVYVSVDEDRCYLPLPRNLDDLRVAADYAKVTAPQHPEPGRRRHRVPRLRPPQWPRAPGPEVPR